MDAEEEVVVTKDAVCSTGRWAVVFRGEGGSLVERLKSSVVRMEAGLNDTSLEKH